MIKFNEIEILELKGYDDGYYWDYRISFKYDNRTFTFINVGSQSGYFINCATIGYIDMSKFLCSMPLLDYNDSYDSPNINELELIRYAKALIESGKEELTLWNEEEEI